MTRFPREYPEQRLRDGLDIRTVEIELDAGGRNSAGLRGLDAPLSARPE
jgi:hypothetical protein